MVDRQPTKPNRIKITFDDGTVKHGYMERADDPTAEGTPLNKATLFDSTAEERYAKETPSEAFNMLTKEWTARVSVSGWTSAPNAAGYYTNQISVTGMKSVYSPIYSVVPTSSETIDDEEGAFATIKGMTTNDGNVVFRALDIPDTDISILIKGV